MEREYYYMFSSGSYSDYCVGGLYKSKEKFDESFFAEYLRQMIIDQIVNWPEAVEHIKNISREDSSDLLGTLSYEYGISKALFEIVSGPSPEPFRDKLAYAGWLSAYKGWKDSVGKFDLDFIKSLTEEGRLEEIEYEEIWNND